MRLINSINLDGNNGFRIFDGGEVIFLKMAMTLIIS